MSVYFWGGVLTGAASVALLACILFVAFMTGVGKR